MLNCLYDSVSLILRKHVEKKILLDNMDGVFQVVDEICSDGYVRTNYISILTNLPSVFALLKQLMMDVCVY